MHDKMKFGMFVIGIVAALQVIAWIMGFNGSVFAFTSFIIGGITGSLLKNSLNIAEYLRSQRK